MTTEPGYFYHICNRGNNAQQIFYTRENYFFSLQKMKEHLSPYVSIIAWCLMPNHFHWIVFVHKSEILITSHTMTPGHGMTKTRTSDKDRENLYSMTPGHGMTKTRTLNYSVGILLRSYTRAIQKQQNSVGSLFQQHTKFQPLVDEIKIEPSYWNDAFGTVINIPEGESYLETCVRYVHLNPVNAGEVKKPEDWEFSSYRDYTGMRNGKLIDYELIEKEGLLPGKSEEEVEGFVSNSNRTMTSSHSMTENSMTKKSLSGKSEEDIEDSGSKSSHTMTSSHSMTKNTAILGIGSNINADENISRMMEILGSQVEILKVSSFVRTKPIGIENQPDFTNGAVKIKTELNQEDLNSLLKNIEDLMGRDRNGPKYGPRVIDLDIVIWNGEVVDDDYYSRDFLKKSVQEII